MVSFLGLCLLGATLLTLMRPTCAALLDSPDDSSFQNIRPAVSLIQKLPAGFPTEVPASATSLLPLKTETILPAGVSAGLEASATSPSEPAFWTKSGTVKISPYRKDLPDSPVTTGKPEICTPILCTQSHFTQEYVNTTSCYFIFASTSWRCSSTRLYTSTCLSYAKPLPDCLYYNTSVPVVSRTSRDWLQIPHVIYDTKTPTTSLVCIPPPPNTSLVCTSWCSYSSRLPPNGINPCLNTKSGCFGTTSTCIEDLPKCLYAQYITGRRAECIPPTMPVGGCSTATYYSPSAVHSGTTDYLTTSTCIFSDRPVDSTRCFVYNTIGKLQCILFSDATKAPSTVVSTTAPTTTTSSSTSIANRLSCAYGTTTFPFTWKLCSGQSCATSSSTIAQCKEIFTSTTHSISWSPPSSSSISSMRTSISTNPSRTQSATVTPTFHPGNQKIEIYLDDSIVGFLSTLVVRYCQYQWCENALIHSEIMDNLHLNGFTADELRSRRLSNTNEYVFEDNNATEWWATNAMTDYITQEYIHNRPLGRTIVIDEMLQGLESEKLAEYNEDESPTTSTATVQEAPTLTPVCSLSSGVPMAIDEVMALASALEWRFGQMVLKPKSTPSCVPYQVGAQYACRCNISTTTGTFRMNPRTYTTTQGGSAKLTTNICGYTTWPKGSTAAIATNKPKTQSSGRRIPTATLRTSTSSKSSTTFASGAGPMPTESPRCEKDGVWWESRVFDNSIASFCKALVDENWKATGNNKLPYHYDYKIVGRDSWPHDRDLRLLIQFEEKACRSKSETVVEFTENSSSKGRISRKSCMEHFTRVKNCGKPMRSDNKDFFLGAGLYSSCLWWRAYRTGSKNPAPGVQKLAELVDELSLNVTRNIEESLRALERDQHSSNDTAGLTLDQAIDLKNGTGRNGTSADL